MPLELVGVKEAAEIVGITVDQFWTVRHYPDFPQAVANPASGAIWHKSDVERFGRNYARSRQHAAA